MRLAVPPALDAAAFRGWDPHAVIASLGGETMGTNWRVQLATTGNVDLAALKRSVETTLGDLVAQMSHWEPDSVLGRFNAASAGSWTILPPDFATVMRAAFDVARRSDGAFDPAIGGLVDIWGFGPVPADRAPDTITIERARASGGWRALTFEDGALPRLRQPGVAKLDLSGIAKGYAVDRLASLLAEHGVRHALVEVGGEFVGMGMRPDADPWWVELETPVASVPPIRVALHQLAVATSGDYIRGRHTIDPRTGYPVTHAAAVSVLHSSAMMADAWATALSVIEPEASLALAERESIAARILTRSGAEVVEMITPRLAEMIG